jgi:hypothetical protein
VLPITAAKVFGADALPVTLQGLPMRLHLATLPADGYDAARALERITLFTGSPVGLERVARKGERLARKHLKRGAPGYYGYLQDAADKARLKAVAKMVERGVKPADVDSLLAAVVSQRDPRGRELMMNLVTRNTTDVGVVRKVEAFAQKMEFDPKTALNGLVRGQPGNWEGSHYMGAGIYARRRLEELTGKPLPAKAALEAKMLLAQAAGAGPESWLAKLGEMLINMLSTV